jgi:hypothetical protein
MKWRQGGLKARRNGSAEPQAQHPSHSTSSTASEDCGCTHSSLPLLQELAADAQEALTISLIRFVFAGYCSGRVDAWDHGFEAAASVLGHEGGAVFFARVLTLGRAVKAERQGDFKFLPGHCNRVSEDEMELLGALQAARSGDPHLFEQGMIVLSRQLHTERLLAAMTAMANLIGMITNETDAKSPSHAAARAPVGTILH